MKKLFLLLLVCSLPMMAQRTAIRSSGNITASSTDCSTAGSCVSATLTEDNAAAIIDLSGTFALTAQFEITSDGTNWRSASATPLAGGSAVTSATGAGAWRVVASGAVGIRVRCSAFTSGTAVTSITVGNGSASTGNGGGTPGGSNAQIQYNNSGAFGGAANTSLDSSGNAVFNTVGTGTAPTACGTATACVAATEASTAGTPTAGQDYMRFDSTLHGIKFSFNNGAEGQSFLSGTSFGVGAPSASCGNGICFAELAAPSGLAGYDLLYPDSTAHRWTMNNNNGGPVTVMSTSDSVLAAQMPALTGDCTTSAGAVATTCTSINNVNIQRVTMTADWTCGTGGTVTACASGTIVGASGTPMTIVLPSVAGKSYHWQCDGVVGQATAATANTWQVEMATNAATNLEATYSMATAATASAYGALTGLATTTITAIGANWTLGGTATKMPFHIQGSIEGASASGTTINLRITGGNNADLITIYRGATCSVAPF